MTGSLFDLTDISFFELDRLFARSAKTVKRRQQKRKRREKRNADTSSSERSRSPPRRGSLRMGGRVLPQTGGFTDKVGMVERTIVVTAIPFGADEKILFKHFSKCGLIEDLQMIYNKKSEPTGVAIIEFSQEEPVSRACALPPPFNEILGQVVQAKRADAQIPKKDPGPKRTLTRQQFTQQVLSGLTKAPSDNQNMRKLHVKNLRPVVRDEDLRSIFKPFGEFEDFQMGSGECWITFKNHNDAQDAMSSMQAFQLVGQELSITMLSVKAEEKEEKAAKPMDLDIKNDSDFGATSAGATSAE
ncbi:unnamed protein product [Effrenium voratum]|uniref:RRM domain-containing protein n=1 Tax=Effrenium voratum TaxID=2562239 RepID=A0AA36HZP8_9DINO|nr:unnamed protein product [Effrenium voratum]